MSDRLILILSKQTIRKLDCAGGVVDLPLLCEERNLQDPLSSLVAQFLTANFVSANRTM